MKFETILFDMDGTILDTLDDLTGSCNYAMRQMGYPEHTRDEVRTFINNGARRLVGAAMPANTTEADLDKTLEIFQAHYREHLAEKTQPYPGILELLDTLNQRGIVCAVVSNKFDVAVKKLSKQYFGDRLAVSVGEHEAEGIRRKPWPDTVFEALRILGKPTETALYVGDTDVDLATARNAGLPCLSVSWGFKSRSFLEDAGAVVIADCVEDFIPCMEKMENEM